MSTRFYYSVVRFVPDDLRDESINIGVLLQPELSVTNAKCVAKFSRNFSRAASIDPTGDRNSIQRILTATERRLLEECVLHDLNTLAERYCAGAVQITTPRLALADDPTKELEDLVGRFLVDDEPVRELGVTDARLRQELKQSLNRLSVVPPNVVRFAHKRAPISFKGRTAEHHFDLSLSSPKRIDLVRCITFDVKGYPEKIDAAKVLAFDSQDVRLTDSRIVVSSVLYPPHHYVNGNVDAFYQAKDILSTQGITTYDFSRPSEVENLVKLAQERIQEVVA